MNSFLKCDEVSPQLIQKVENSEYAIDIEQGSQFSWGFPKEKEIDNKTKDEKKIDDDVNKTVDDEKDDKKELIPQTVGDLVILRDIGLKVKHGEFITVIGE